MKTPTALVLAASLALPLGGTAHRKTEEGNRRYLAEELEAALGAYTEAQVAAPDAPELFYDLGNVLYRQGDFAGAEELYERALASATPELAPDAAFNLGNALFHQQVFDEAIEAYKKTLAARPDDVDAKRNLELALRQLQQQQQQQQQQQGGDQEPEDDENPEQQQQREQQQQQEPQQQQEQQQGQEQEPDEPRAEQGKDRQERPQDQPGKMSRQEAERLLDSLENQERENLRRERMRLKKQAGTKRERDW